jgi:RPA family protein
MIEQKEYNRATAIKISIVQLLQGTYIQEKEQNPNYLLTLDNQKIYRLNIIGIVIHKEQIGTIVNLIIDDSTESIIVRSFEENKNISSINVGEIINVIGKIRIFNEEKYISPEIVKKISPIWLKIRSQEIDKLFSFQKSEKNNIEKETSKKTSEPKQSQPLEKELKKTKNIEQKINQKKEQINKEKRDDKKEEEEIEVDIEEITDQKTAQEENELPTQKIIKLIKELDQGNGVFIEDIIEKSTLRESEKIIDKMLEKGDIYQNIPGKVKVL